MKIYYLIMLIILLFFLFTVTCTQEIVITPGKYVLVDDPNVFLIIQPDTSFQLQANLCEGLGLYYGSYRQEKGILVCMAEKADFKNSGWEEIQEFRFKITSETSLQYTGEQVACGPYEESILKRIDEWDEAVDDTRQEVIDDNYDDIFTAATEGNIEAVKKFIADGVAVDTKDDFDWTPLVYAVEAEQEKVVEYLIQMGADVNEYQYAVGPGEDTSIFDLAMNTGNQKIIDLLLSADVDEHIIMNYYDDKLYEHLAMDEIEKAEALITQEKASFPSSSNLMLLVHYTTGSSGVRELIKKYGPTEIADGSVNLLDNIIPGSISFDYEMPVDSIQFPLATTFKHDESAALRFSPEKAFDNDNTTSWREGVEGAGIGEKIAFYAEESINLLSIITGIADNNNFKKYNRIKKAYLRFYIEKGGVAMISANFTYESVGDEYDLNFADSMDMQEFPIQLPDFISEEGNMICVLEIASVYPGTEFDDTGITEMRLDLDTRYGY